MIEPIEGIVVDPDRKQVTCLGRRLHVAFFEYSPGYPDQPTDPDRDYSSAHIEMMQAFVSTMETEATLDEILYGPKQGMPEAFHLNVMCGENGWWVEATIYPEYEDLSLDLPQSEGPILDGQTPQDLLDWIDATAMLGPYEPEDEHDTPFAGCAPGTWIWMDLPPWVKT